MNIRLEQPKDYREVENLTREAFVLGSISCKFFARPNAAMVDDKCMTPDVKVNLDDKDAAWKYIIDNYGRKNENSMKQKFCQSCGMPPTEDILGTNADGSKNEDYCMYCYRWPFLQRFLSPQFCY